MKNAECRNKTEAFTFRFSSFILLHSPFQCPASEQDVSFNKKLEMRDEIGLAQRR